MINITKKSLLQLPKRAQNKTTIYDSIVLINSRKKHDSGYAIMYIVGYINLKPVEIIRGSTDSIIWNLNGLHLYTDMFYPSGLIHFFNFDCKIEVSEALSTTFVNLIKKEGE